MDAQGTLFPSGTARKVLFKTFESCSSFDRPLIRKLLGPLDESDENPPYLLLYDLDRAIRTFNAAEILHITNLGAKVSCHEVCQMLPLCAPVDVVSTLISTQGFNSNELGQILRDAFRLKFSKVIDYVLYESEVEPEITYEILNDCVKLRKFEKALDIFRKCLEIAGRSGTILADSKKLRRIVKHSGPLWLAEWDKHEEPFKVPKK